MTVVTRFAPSPTGFLHIGGARTALFNYLFARHHQGTYRLRIEDTDKQRSTPEAVAAIHDGLAWLGLGGDGEVVYQSQRRDRHIEIAEQLLQTGHAYRCYLTADEFKALREEAYTSGKQVISPWRDAPISSAPDKPFTVRLRMPLDGTTTITDAVQGRVTIAHKTLDDLVMLRSDGTPTYMLAVVVDDFDMGVSHVIRGDDHLNNAFRQHKIIEALGWPVPQYAHIPLIHGTDNTKMSKRGDAVAVGEYRDQGFLAEALGNYLLRLGWSHGDDEIISREQAIEWFSLGAIGKAPARFDGKKLADLNRRYIRALPSDEVVQIMLGGGQAAPADIVPADTAPRSQAPAPAHIIKRLQMLAAACAERAETLGDLQNLDFITSDDAPQLSREAQALLTPEAQERLSSLALALPDNLDSHDAFKTWLNSWLEAQGLKMRDIGPALRAALTGRVQTPDITLIAAALGTTQIVKRIKALYK